MIFGNLKRSQRSFARNVSASYSVKGRIGNINTPTPDIIHQLYARKVVELVYCPTERMTANVMRNPLGPTMHMQYCQAFGLQQ